jgi:hypothetical protein
VLASFLNLKGWRFLTASLIFEADPSLTVLGRIDLNRNMHTGFQAEFFKSEPQDRSRWLDPFLSMVPEGAAAAAALSMPAREFLHEMYRAVDPELRPEIDRQIKRTGKFDGVGPMIDSLEDALLRRIGFVFYRARDLGEEITTFEPSKAPHVAWVFWIRPEFRHRLRDLYDFLTDNASTLGFDKTYDYPVTGLKGGDAAREFANANIPGTGEVVVLLYGNFFILSNSAVLVRHMVLARHEGHSILGNKDYEVFEQELPKTLNAFVFLQGKRIEEIVLDNIGFLEESTKTPDEGWMADNHARIERQVLRAQYPGARSVAEVPASQRDAFDAAVDLAKDREWLTARTQFIARDRSRLEQVLALSRMFSAAYLQATLDPQSLQTTSRILIDYR